MAISAAGIAGLGGVRRSATGQAASATSRSALPRPRRAAIGRVAAAGRRVAGRRSVARPDTVPGCGVVERDRPGWAGAAGRRSASVEDVDPLVPAFEALVGSSARGVRSRRCGGRSVHRAVGRRADGAGHEAARGPWPGCSKESVQPAGQRATRRGTAAPGPRRPVPANINEQVKAFEAAGDPVISVDTKKRVYRVHSLTATTSRNHRSPRRSERARLRRPGAGADAPTGLST